MANYTKAMLREFSPSRPWRFGFLLLACLVLLFGSAYLKKSLIHTKVLVTHNLPAYSATMADGKRGVSLLVGKGMFDFTEKTFSPAYLKAVALADSEMLLNWGPERLDRTVGLLESRIDGSASMRKYVASRKANVLRTGMMSAFFMEGLLYRQSDAVIADIRAVPERYRVDNMPEDWEFQSVKGNRDSDGNIVVGDNVVEIAGFIVCSKEGQAYPLRTKTKILLNYSEKDGLPVLSKVKVWERAYDFRVKMGTDGESLVEALTIERCYGLD